jgi:hypothetical protein
MKSQPLSIRRIGVLFTLPVLAALFGTQYSCSTTQAMRSGETVPASEGTVNTKKSDNGNTRVIIRVKHLAPPSKVSPGATVYLVWVQPRNTIKKSVGVLTLNDNLEGRLETMTPHSQFLVTVTPEASREVAQPTHEPVFTFNVN